MQTAKTLASFPYFLPTVAQFIETFSQLFIENVSLVNQGCVLVAHHINLPLHLIDVLSRVCCQFLAAFVNLAHFRYLLPLKIHKYKILSMLQKKNLQVQLPPVSSFNI